jgi:hypothetical protein
LWEFGFWSILDRPSKSVSHYLAWFPFSDHDVVSRFGVLWLCDGWLRAVENFEVQRCVSHLATGTRLTCGQEDCGEERSTLHNHTIFHDAAGRCLLRCCSEYRICFAYAMRILSSVHGAECEGNVNDSRYTGRKSEYTPLLQMAVDIRK